MNFNINSFKKALTNLILGCGGRMKKLFHLLFLPTLLAISFNSHAEVDFKFAKLIAVCKQETPLSDPDFPALYKGSSFALYELDSKLYTRYHRYGYGFLERKSILKIISSDNNSYAIEIDLFKLNAIFDKDQVFIYDGDKQMTCEESSDGILALTLSEALDS